jgi:ABC-type glycerol-3-phosphate transport system substrate-binding protein
VASRTVSHTRGQQRRAAATPSRRAALQLLGLSLAGTVPAALAAWGGAPDATGTAGAPQGKVVELRVHGQGTSDGEGYDKNVAAFNERFAGRYRAVHEQVTGNLYEKQEAGFAGGTAADLHYAHTSNMKYHEYSVKGIALGLDAFTSRDKDFRLTDWPTRAIDVIKSVDGKVYGLPIRGQVSWLFLYWNRDLLRKAGVPEPTPDWTLDDLVTHARRLVGQGPGPDFYPVGHAWGGFERTVANVRRFGGEFFSPADGPGTKCALDSAQCVQAFRWFYEHIKSGLFAPPAYGPAEFGQGKTAFVLGHLAGQRATVANNAGSNFEWTFDVVPKGPTGRRGGFLSIDMQQIWAQTASKDGSWELLKWLTNKQSGINIALQPVGSLTPGYRKDVYCSEELLNDARFPKSAMQANCNNLEQPDGFTYPHNFRLVIPGGVNEVVTRYTTAIGDLTQEPTPAIMRELTQEVQKVLDQPRL